MKWMDDPTYDVPFFTFENLERTGMVTNAFTTKFYWKNGRGTGKTINDFFQPLLRVSSEPEEVAHCETLLKQQFNVKDGYLISSAQKHTNNIYQITADDVESSVNGNLHLESIDGLITDIPGVMLETFGADCPSVYIVDPVHKAIGLCHSGRKGTQTHIAAVMLEAMNKAYGTQPSDVSAAISPGICTNCYEVGNDVAEDFAEDYKNKTKFMNPSSANVSAGHPDTYAADGCHHSANNNINIVNTDMNIKNITVNSNSSEIISCLPHINGRYHIDLFRAISQSLTACGVNPDNIEVSHLCTRCRSDIFYSFRAEGKISNENCGLLMINA